MNTLELLLLSIAARTKLSGSEASEYVSREEYVDQTNSGGYSAAEAQHALDLLRHKGYLEEYPRGMLTNAQAYRVTHRGEREYLTGSTADYEANIRVVADAVQTFGSFVSNRDVHGSTKLSQGFVDHAFFELEHRGLVLLSAPSAAAGLMIRATPTPALVEYLTTHYMRS
jgi:hypothetical protein